MGAAGIFPAPAPLGWQREGGGLTPGYTQGSRERWVAGGQPRADGAVLRAERAMGPRDGAGITSNFRFRRMVASMATWGAWS